MIIQNVKNFSVACNICGAYKLFRKKNYSRQMFFMITNLMMFNSISWGPYHNYWINFTGNDSWGHSFTSWILTILFCSKSVFMYTFCELDFLYSHPDKWILRFLFLLFFRWHWWIFIQDEGKMCNHKLCFMTSILNVVLHDISQLSLIK